MNGRSKDERWRTIMELFDSVAALPAHERQAFLNSSQCDSETARQIFDLLAQVEAPHESSPIPQNVEKHSRIGRYIILEKLAEGGMGTIFSARDTELDRVVALKFLDPEMLGGRSVLAKLIREAKVLSALNHPNIVTVHEVIQSEQTCAIVMELVEGAVFRPSQPGEFTISQIISAGQQIARALEAAHARGIIHRDIKPENILLRKDGYIKVLDFGIARRIDSATQSGSFGLPMGTLRYMSPEQSRGDVLGGATDIFSLGVVLYEAATGRHPFKGSSIFETARAIAMVEPPAPAALNPAVPPRLDELIRQMIEKTPAARPSAGDVAMILGELAALKEEAKTEAQRPLIARRWLIGSALAGLGGAGVYLVRRRVTPQAPFITLIEKGSAKDPCFSPDGSQIIFSWKPPNSEHFQLYLVGADGGEPRLFSSGPADDIDPAWSPDGERICFVRHGLGESALYTRQVHTGEERRITTLIDSPNSNRLDWLSDSRTVVLAENWFEMPLTLLDTQSGARRELMPAAPAGYSSPRRSPDGKWIAVTKFFSQTTGDLFVAPVKGGEARRLTFDNYGKRCHRWTPDGSGIVFRAPLDNHLALLYVPFQGGMARRFALPYVPSGSFDIKKSPHEKVSLAAADSFGKTAICRMEIPSGSQPPVSPSALIVSAGRDTLDANPAISPDGLRIAFVSTRSGAPELWTTTSEGRGADQLTSFGGSEISQPAWSPDGRYLVSAAARNEKRNVFVVELATRTLRWLTDSGLEETEPQWSRDGKWITFASSRSGSQQLWRMPAAGGTARQLTRKGGAVSRESPDGRSIYYVRHEQPGLWRMPWEGGPETLVLDRVYSELYRAWAVGQQGIYYTFQSGSPPIWSIRLLSPENGAERTLATFDKPLPRWSGTLAISPDERWMLLPIWQVQASSLLLFPEVHI